MTIKLNGYESLNTAAKEILLNEIAQELYQQNRKFTPKYPWVFIRILSKEQQIGSIVLPDSEQNKTIHEGIVLATWEPIIKYEQRRCNTCDKVRVQKIERESELHPGDHVLLPHYAGLPVPDYHDKNYRIVKECDWELSQEGGIMAVVSYGNRANKPIEVLKREVADTLGLAEDDGYKLEWTLIVQALEKAERRMLFVDRNQHSVTLSGR